MSTHPDREALLSQWDKMFSDSPIMRELGDELPTQFLHDADYCPNTGAVDWINEDLSVQIIVTESELYGDKVEVGIYGRVHDDPTGYFSHPLASSETENAATAAEWIRRTSLF